MRRRDSVQHAGQLGQSPRDHRSSPASQLARCAADHADPHGSADDNTLLSTVVASHRSLLDECPIIWGCGVWLWLQAYRASSTSRAAASIGRGCGPLPGCMSALIREAEGAVLMSARVFINYRGSDSHSYAALLYGELSRAFGQENVFLDSES